MIMSIKQREIKIEPNISRAHIGLTIIEGVFGKTP